MASGDDTFDPIRRKTVLGATTLVGGASAGLLAGIASASAGSGAAHGELGYDGTLAVRGSSFINGHGSVVQLRGTDTEGYVSASINNFNQGSGGDISGGGANFDQPHNGPSLATLKTWKMNVIRLGINEASWLGQTCYKPDGTAVNPDPHGVYRSQMTRQIAAFNAIGCYVMLVLAWTNPGRSAPFGQDLMANEDNSIDCWKSIASYYGYPHGTALKRNGGTVDDRSVIFELFNEPEPYGDAPAPWKLVMEGGFYAGPYAFNNPFTPIYPYPCEAPAGAFKPGESVTISGGIAAKVLCYHENKTIGLASSGTRFIHLFDLADAAMPGHPLRMSGSTLSKSAVVTGTVSGATTRITSGNFGWHVAGHTQLLAAVRSAGAWNVCLLSGVDYAKDLGKWGIYAPADNTAPAGYSGPPWTPQIGASWHPYPACSWVSKASVAKGGSGYQVGDTILLPMPETGPLANSVYWQAQLQVSDVDAGAVTSVHPVSYTGGTPGKRSSGGNGNYNFHNMVGGVYCNLALPSNPIPQESSSGSGTGATFNLAFTAGGGDSGTGNWPNYDTWGQVVALKSSFNAIGVPICITETGEHTGKGVSGSPWMAALTTWCDQNGISLLSFCYNPADGWYSPLGADFALILSDGTPSPGYGTFMFNWFTRHAP
jgi:hypothetical protein